MYHKDLKLPKAIAKSPKGVVLNISFAYNNEPPLKAYIHREEPLKILPLLLGENLLTKLDPELGLPKIQIIYFSDYGTDKNLTFVYIEGLRCKSDGFSKRCWSEPSFCLGWEEYCFRADDKFSLCNNIEWDSHVPYFTKSSLIDSINLFWAEPKIMSIIEHDNISAEVIENEPIPRDWQCNFVDDEMDNMNITNILCTTSRIKYWIYSNLIDKGLSVTLLKTIGGGG